MSRPGPLPTAPDHQLHDPLLVAQFAAGDALDPDRQRQGESLVSSCGACAALAADLRAVAAAVAWEPVPRRRRELRLSVAQVERARGGFMSRLMRRLALPQARSLRPVAGAVMSLGLLFVVGGTVWPVDQPGAGVALPSTTPKAVDARAQAPLAESAELLEDAAPDGDAATGGVIPESAVTDDIAESAVADDIAEPGSDTAEPAGVSGAASQKAARDRDGAGDRLIERFEASDATIEELGEEEPALAAGSDAEALEPLTGIGSIVATAPPAADVQVDAIRDAVDEAEEGPTQTAADPDSDVEIEAVLMVVGLVLALAGALLLLLMWLARRSTDPLLR